MLNKLRERAQGESGFTLIELLVVMLIIGLLAAIAIPSFFNQRDKANDADAKEQVRTAQTAAETFATDNAGSYAPGGTAMIVGDLTKIESTLSGLGSRLTVDSATGNSYKVTVKAANTNNTFSIARSSTGAITYTCDVASVTTGAETGGGCSNGKWG